MFFLPRTSRAAFCAALSLAILTGCSSLAPIISTNAVSVTGNWQLASTATAAAKLPALSGELTGTGASMTGIFHSDSASACVSPSSSFDVSGSTNSAGLTTLTGSLAGGALTVSGTLAANGKSLTNATYNITGGACAFAAASPVTAQSFSPINGTFTGTFSDANGPVTTLTATLTQTPSSDPNGNFQLSGTGTFPNNPCFNSPVSVSNTQVTGGNFTLTYADPTTNNSVTASGTFSQSGTTLTITNWTMTGPCGPDTGTGLLTQ